MGWRSLFRLLPLLFLLVVVGPVRSSGLRICAYNLQEFNKMKASTHRVMHTLTRVLSRCHVSLLQEVVDPDGSIMRTLLAALNRYRYEDHKYQSVSSRSPGSPASTKQQFIFIYRRGAVNMTGQYRYQKAQSFVNEPFALQFQSEQTAAKKFVLVAVNTRPERTVQEIDRLEDVFKEVAKTFNTQNVMFLGNFHAGCAYMTRADKKKIRLFKNLDFSWLIGDKVDTTVSEQTSCAYDRIVVHGESFLKSVSPHSARVFRVNKELRIPTSMVLAISDHFPIEVVLKSSAHLLQATALLALVSVSAIVCSSLPAL